MNWEHVVEIQQVVNGYFRALDEKDLDAAHLRRILTDDAKVICSIGDAMIGPEQLVRVIVKAWRASKARSTASAATTSRSTLTQRPCAPIWLRSTSGPARERC